MNAGMSNEDIDAAFEAEEMAGKWFEIVPIDDFDFLWLQTLWSGAIVPVGIS